MFRFKTLFQSPIQTAFSRPAPIFGRLCRLPLSLKLSQPLFQPYLHFTPSFYASSSKIGEKDPPASLPSFKPYNLSQSMLDALAEMDVNVPTPIQNLVLNEWISHNRHIVFAAQTGTGKTLAYAIPLLEGLKSKEVKAKTVLTIPKRPRAVIFVPNKELVMQTQDVIKSLCHQMKLKSYGLCGKDNYIRERETLKEGVDIVIATFDRFEKHHEKQNVFLSQIEAVIIDEVDTFMDAAYADQINHYIDVCLKLPQKPKMIFLSSTFTEKMKGLFASKFGKEQNSFVILLDKNTHYNLSNLEHEFLHLSTFDKQQPLLNLLKEYKIYVEKTNGGTMIFCNSIPSAQSVEYCLKENGHDCVLLHGEVPKQLRIQNYERFRRREVNILISTDLGSRGLDFPWVNHVINFDFPKTASDYIHRAGRAGRAGRKGHVSSLYQSKDFKLIEELQASNNEGRPLNIKGSAFETRPVKGEESKQNNLVKLANNAELKKFLPEDYIQFRKEWEASNENQPKRQRGYKIAKDVDKTKIKELKKKIKMPKRLRTKSSVFIRGVKSKLRRLHKKVHRRKLKENKSKKATR